MAKGCMMAKVRRGQAVVPDRTRSRSGRQAAVLGLQRTEPKDRRGSTVPSFTTACPRLCFGDAGI